MRSQRSRNTIDISSKATRFVGSQENDLPDIDQAAAEKPACSLLFHAILSFMTIPWRFDWNEIIDHNDRQMK